MALAAVIEDSGTAMVLGVMVAWCSLVASLQAGATGTCHIAPATTHRANLLSNSASVITLFFNPGNEMDSFGLCALAFGSSGPVTST